MSTQGHENQGLDAHAAPHVLVNAAALAAATAEATRGGAVWNLDVAERDLDSNIITLPPGDGIGAHTGPDLDVLIHVLAGTGTLHTAGDPVSLRAGLLVWLPRRSRREFRAGPDGLAYLTVHQRRQTQGLWPSSP